MHSFLNTAQGIKPGLPALLCSFLFLFSSPPLICMSHLILKVYLSSLLSFFSHRGPVKCLKIAVRDFSSYLSRPCRKELATAAPHTPSSLYTLPCTHTQHLTKLCPLPSTALGFRNRVFDSARPSLMALLFLSFPPFLLLLLHLVMQKCCCQITPQCLQ